MTRFPFSVYDFFGYLASGFLLLETVDYVVDGQWILVDSSSVVSIAFWTIVAYITGQILASPSAWLLERTIVGRLLQRPSINLFRDAPKYWWTKLFPGYFTPLPVAIREKVLQTAESDGITEKGEAIFVLAFGKVKSDKDTMARLSSFLNLYGFCRNVCFTSLLATLLVAIGSFWGGSLEKLPWALIALVGSAGMFYRFLKFYRQYSYELFITYAAL